jgi:hypothetical protein
MEVVYSCDIVNTNLINPNANEVTVSGDLNVIGDLKVNAQSINQLKQIYHGKFNGELMRINVNLKDKMFYIMLTYFNHCKFFNKTKIYFDSKADCSFTIIERRDNGYKLKVKELKDVFKFKFKNKRKIENIECLIYESIV